MSEGKQNDSSNNSICFLSLMVKKYGWVLLYHLVIMTEIKWLVHSHSNAPAGIYLNFQTIVSGWPQVNTCRIDLYHQEVGVERGGVDCILTNSFFFSSSRRALSNLTNILNFSFEVENGGANRICLIIILWINYLTVYIKDELGAFR